MAHKYIHYSRVQLHCSFIVITRLCNPSLSSYLSFGVNVRDVFTCQTKYRDTDIKQKRKKGNNKLYLTLFLFPPISTQYCCLQDTWNHDNSRLPSGILSSIWCRQRGSPGGSSSVTLRTSLGKGKQEPLLEEKSLPIYRHLYYIVVLKHVVWMFLFNKSINT